MLLITAPITKAILQMASANNDNPLARQRPLPFLPVYPTLLRYLYRLPRSAAVGARALRCPPVLRQASRARRCLLPCPPLQPTLSTQRMKAARSLRVPQELAKRVKRQAWGLASAASAMRAPLLCGAVEMEYPSSRPLR